MKFITQLTAGLVGMSLFTAAMAQNTKAPATAPIKFELPKTGTTPAQPAAATPTLAVPAPAAPAVPAIKYSQAELMEVYGYMMAVRMNLPELEYSVADIDAMAKGIKLALAGQQPPYDAQALSPQLQAFVMQKQQALLAKIKNINLTEGTAFFAKKKEDKAVQFLPSGLGMEVLKAGSGLTPKLGQLAKFHFTLSTITGDVLESSAGREPVEGIVQEGGGMTPGMVEGMQKVAVGGKSKFYVPNNLAFGDGVQGMPPGASLIFEVEMLDVKDAPKEVAPAAAK